jgi:hypothetical protein
MMQVSLGTKGITHMRLWFDRAIAAQIDHAPAWSDMRWGLRPRWYGDEQAMLAFGEAALNTGRFDSDVPRMYFESVRDVETELKLPKGEHIFGREDVWPNLQRLYQGYLGAETNRQNQQGWHSTYAVVAYLAGHLDVARDQLVAVDWKPGEWNLAGWGRDLSLLPLEVAARTGPLQSDVEAAEAALRNNDTDRAWKLYSALARSGSADERTRRFLDVRLAALKQRIGFEAGEWVSLLPADEGLSTWRVIRGECRRLPDGSLEVKSDAVGHMLQARMQTGREFEVKATFSVAKSSTRAFQAGLVMGLPDWETATWYGFRVKRNDDEGDVASFGDGWSKKQLLSHANLHPGTNLFTFRLANGKVSASVNGADLMRDVAPPKNSRIPTNEFYLGLGAFNDMNETVIRYHELQVRKLAGPAAAR